MLDQNHHAYLIIGEREQVWPTVLNLVDELVGELPPIHPDRMIWAVDQWGVDDSRDVKGWQSRRPQGESKCGVIACETMTEIAGQALLKVLEEPAAGVFFILVVPSESVILPTLYSRLAPLALHLAAKFELDPKLKKFLAGLPAERLKYLESVAGAEAWLKNLIKVLAAEREHLEPSLYAEAVRAVQEALNRLAEPHFPDRLALETLALVLPKVVL